MSYLTKKKKNHLASMVLGLTVLQTDQASQH